MSILSQNGVFSVGIQSAKGVAATTFYRHKMLGVQVGGQEMSMPWADEVGGTPYPEGLLKTGAFVGGNVILQPRLSNVFGWLLKAIMGKVSTVSDYPEAGVYTHIFSPDPAATATIPWVTTRKYLPPPDGGSASAEQGLDCKITAAEITLAAQRPLTMTMGYLGRVPSWPDPSAWSYENEYEDVTSVPVGNTGSFTLPDFGVSAQPVPAVQVQVANVLSGGQLRSEFILGSYYPDDLVVTKRSTGVRFTLKINDYALFKTILTGSDSGATWTPEVYATDMVARVESPGNISGHSVPYSFEVRAEAVDWAVEGPPALAGNSVIYLPVIGIAKRPSSGNPWEFRLVNTQPGYV